MTAPPEPRPRRTWRRPTVTEALRSGLAWAWTMAVFLIAPVSSLLTLGLFGSALTTFWAHAWGGPTLRLMGIDVEVRGLHHLRVPGSRIVVANHQSALDMPLFAMIAPRAPLVLAKAELRWLFPFNVMWVALGQRFVDRRNHEAARRSVAALVEALRREERSVVLAPEGTRSRTGELGPFKLGAFHMAVETGVPIVPVCFHGVGRLMPPGRWWAEAGRCVVEVHPPIDTRGWTADHVHEYADSLRADYLRWLAAEAAQA